MKKQTLDFALSEIADNYINEASDKTAVHKTFSKRKNIFKVPMAAAIVLIFLTVVLVCSFAVMNYFAALNPASPGSTTTYQSGRDQNTVSTTSQIPTVTEPPGTIPLIPEGYTAIPLTFRSNGNGTSTVQGLDKYFAKENFIVKDDETEYVIAYMQTEYLFVQNHCVIYQYRDEIKIGIDYSADVFDTETIIIPDGVTEIPIHAFTNFVNLKSITIPDSVTKIGDAAFHYCSSLTEINLPDGITEIGMYAFNNCTSLEKINIPTSLSIITRESFSECPSLKNIIIPEGIIKIEEVAFAHTGLESIVIPKSVESIGLWILADSPKLTSLTIPFIGENREKPGTLSYLFSTSIVGIKERLKTLIITDTLEIADLALNSESTSLLETLILNEGIRVIGKNAFPSSEYLKEIKIPDSVIIANSLCGYGTETLYIGSGLMIITPEFAAYTKLKNISVSADNQYFCAVDNVLFTLDMSVLVRYCSGSEATEYTVPESVKGIADYGFLHSANLEKIILPEGLSIIGSYAFYWCFGITEYYIPESVLFIGNIAFTCSFGKITIKCAAKSKPVGWDEEWVESAYTTTVIWNYKI